MVQVTSAESTNGYLCSAPDDHGQVITIVAMLLITMLNLVIIIGKSSVSMAMEQ